jgi:hypothetical protein
MTVTLSLTLQTPQRQHQRLQPMTAPQRAVPLISKSSLTTKPHKVVTPEQSTLMPLAHSKQRKKTSLQRSQSQ